MRATCAQWFLKWLRFGRSLSLPKMALLIVALGTIAYGGQITIFWDDFEHYDPGDNPAVPPTGEPWQVSEAFPEGIRVEPDWLNPNSRALLFGRGRNTALAPFSPDSRQLIALERNATVSFDYFGITSHLGYSQYFDVAAYDPLTGDPAFLIRFSPQENPGSGGFHDVYYLDPAGGLIDSQVDVLYDRVQTVTIEADFAQETYQLAVHDDQSNSADLPMFTCPDEIVGVEFANYGVAMGSGSIDNLGVTVEQADGESSIPEVATLWMAVAGLLALLVIWTARWRAK